MTPKRASYVAVAVIGAYWIFAVLRQVLRDPASQRTPGSILLGACVRAVITAVLVVVLLRLAGASLRTLGFTVDRLGPFVLRTLGLTAGLFVLSNVVNTALHALIGHGTPPVAELFRDPGAAPMWVVSAIVGGGFAEELGRAFTLTRFEAAFGRAGLTFALVVDTIVFGLGHLYQGPAAAVSAGVTGLVLAFIFLWRRRVIEAMAVHALFDLVGIAAAYSLYGRTP